MRVPKYPLIPALMAPATDTAKPPRMIILRSPKIDRPATRAKDTMRPFDNPFVRSDKSLTLMEVRRSVENFLRSELKRESCPMEDVWVAFSRPDRETSCNSRS